MLRGVRQVADELAEGTSVSTTAAKVLQLHSPFRYGRQFAGVNCEPALAASMAEALSAAGLPE
jgi:hypothetical protein